MTEQIVELTESDIDGIQKLGIVRLLVELDENGFPNREIGLNKFNRIIHKYPDPNKKSYSVFSDAPIILSKSSTNNKLEISNFNLLWKGLQE